ncbi:aminotransferase class V-fold PLP-dependent enzyme [Halapricum desulfuricans]|uniref:Selenocysteine lyase/Cysteine desulfurase n=1 Tax=Halapricum desulfuricans TaxID=2841257 RepID=A0A897NCB4_9EURY|nr:aminotransferase class V-fold PLP-dependent enzyme [Halapricum desulfuricans]QSG09075.1 Selenocysteine lyase/Cysteine desulfurase [Halapricum desulfuricans]
MDPEQLRADIPALERATYLNTGASSPSPRRVVEAMTDFAAYFEYEVPAGEGVYEVGWETYEAARETIADFLGADADEIALTRSTADGVNLLACAIDWQPGDVVVRTDLEHPAGILPWDRLADLDRIEVRVLETEDGRVDLDAVAAAAEDARLFAVSSLTWTHGTRLPIGEIADIAHDAGARVLVDAVQSPGQYPVDLDDWGADFVVGAGHKWLLGPFGSGFAYVDSDAIDELVPRRIGYRSVEEPTDPEYAFKDGASRFEVGTASPLPHVGLSEAMDLLEEIGVKTVEARIERLTDRLKDGIDDERLLSPREYESGLVTFRVDDPEATVERLRERGVIVRSLPYPKAVRASVHAFNTADDIDALLEGL